MKRMRRNLIAGVLGALLAIALPGSILAQAAPSGQSQDPTKITLGADGQATVTVNGAGEHAFELLLPAPEVKQVGKTYRFANPMTKLTEPASTLLRPDQVYPLQKEFGREYAGKTAGDLNSNELAFLSWYYNAGPGKSTRKTICGCVPAHSGGHACATPRCCNLAGQVVVQEMKTVVGDAQKLALTVIVNCNDSKFLEMIAELSRKVTALEGRWVPTKAEWDQLIADVKDLQDRMANLEKRVSALEAWRVTVDEKLANHEMRIVALEGEIPKLNARIDRLRHDMNLLAALNFVVGVVGWVLPINQCCPVRDGGSWCPPGN